MAEAVDYETAWVLTRQMLDAAKNGEWDELILIEKKRAQVVADLMRSRPDVDARINETIQHILACDAEIKALTEAWLGELRETLDSTISEKKLLQAYGPPA